MHRHRNRMPHHPAEFIKAELDARGLSQRDLAFILGCPEQGVNMLLTGKRGVSPDMAKSLESAFGIPADVFSDLQRVYDLANASDPNPGIAKRARMQLTYPIREMINRGWLKDTDASTLETQMARFFEVLHIDDVPHMAPASKRTKYDEIPPDQLAWLFRVKQVAKSIAVPEYSEKSLKKALLNFKEILFDPKWFREISHILEKCGVRLVCVEPLTGSKIDGACLWLDSTSPVIAMPLRNDRIDNFLAVLNHEIRRVLYRQGRDKAIIDVGIPRNTDGFVAEEQKIYNSVASNLCASIAERDSFAARKSSFFSDRYMKEFEKIMKAYPELAANPAFARKVMQEAIKAGRNKKFMDHLE